MADVDQPTDVLDTREAGGRIIRGGAIRGIGFVLTTLIALVGIALVTRYLGVVEFGRFQTVISLITMVGAITDAGMLTLGLREYAQRTGHARDELMRSLLGLRLVLTFVGVLIATAIAAAVGYDADLVVGTLLAGVGLALIVTQTTLTIPLATELRNGTLTAIDLLRQVLTVGGYAVLVAIGASVVAFLGVTIPVGVACVVVAAVLVRTKISVVPSLRPLEWGRLLRATVAFAMASAVGTVYAYTAQVLTAAVANADDTGLFSAAFRVFIIVAGTAGILVTVAFPLLSRAARDDHERFAYAVHRLFDTSTILGYAAAIGMVVGAPTIIDVMAGSSFADAVPALRILGLAVIASFALAPIGFALLSLHAHRAILLANLAALVTMLTAVGVLASTYGANGAAIGTVIGESTLALSYIVALARVAPDVVPGVGRAARALVVAVPCVLLVFVTALPAWVATAIALAAYGLLLIAVRALPEELVELVRNRGEARG